MLTRLLLALVILASPAYAVDSRTFTNRSDSSVSSVTAETLMSANAQRRFLFIQNIGSVDVWVSITGTAAVDTAGSFKLIPGASITMEGETVPRNAVSIKAASSSGVVTAYEG